MPAGRLGVGEKVPPSSEKGRNWTAANCARSGGGRAKQKLRVGKGHQQQSGRDAHHANHGKNQGGFHKKAWFLCCAPAAITPRRQRAASPPWAVAARGHAAQPRRRGKANAARLASAARVANWRLGGSLGARCWLAAPAPSSIHDNMMPRSNLLRQ